MMQIDGVNLAANSLVDSGHPRSEEVKKYQDHLNSRSGWVGLGAEDIFSQPLTHPWGTAQKSGSLLGTVGFVPSELLSFSVTVSF